MYVGVRAGKIPSIGISTGSEILKGKQALLAFHFQSSLYYLSAPRCKYNILIRFHKTRSSLMRGCFTTGVGWRLIVPLPRHLLRGLRVELLFILREDCKRRAFIGRVVALAGVATSVGEQQLTALKTYNGAPSSKKSAPNKPAASVGS